MTLEKGAPEPSSAWAAFQYRDFRLLWLARLISQTGTSMQVAVLNWHVWNLTHNELALGGVGLVRLAPIIGLSLFGGMVADALNRRWLLVSTQSAMLFCSLALAAASLAGAESIALLYLMSGLTAAAVAFDNPAMQALIPNLVPSKHLSNAISLNMMMFQVSLIAGPALSGLVIGAGGPGLAYTLNAASFLATIVAISRLRASGKPASSGQVGLGALREGLAFVRSMPLIWSSMLLDFFATFFASALALLPVYADQILRVGSVGYGILSAAPGIGAAVTSLVMARLGNLRRQGKLMLASVAVYGLATAVLGLSASFWVALVALVVIGGADTVSAILRSTVRQLLTPDRLRGRMTSVNMIFFMGGPQLGEFEAGALARLTSTPFSVVSGGVATLLVVALIALRVPVLRRYDGQLGADGLPAGPASQPPAKPLPEAPALAPGP